MVVGKNGSNSTTQDRFDTCDSVETYREASEADGAIYRHFVAQKTDIQEETYDDVWVVVQFNKIARRIPAEILNLRSLFDFISPVSSVAKYMSQGGIEPENLTILHGMIVKHFGDVRPSIAVSDFDIGQIHVTWPWMDDVKGCMAKEDLLIREAIEYGHARGFHLLHQIVARAEYV